MKTIIAAGSLLAIAAIALIYSSGTTSSPPPKAHKAADAPEKQVVQHTRKRPALEEAPEPTSAGEAGDKPRKRKIHSLRRLPPLNPNMKVQLSSKEQREGEPDQIYKSRLHWLEKWESFKRRGNLSERQHARLLQLIASKQEEAAMAWEMSFQAVGEATLDELEQAADDVENAPFPTMMHLDREMQKDLWAELKTFLTKEQFVSYRRTSRLNSPFGWGRWKPVDIEMTSSESE